MSQKTKNNYANALVQISKDKLATTIAEIPEEFFEMDYKNLEKEVSPSDTQRHLKITVQEEIEAAQLEGRRINTSNFYKGVCHQSYFYKEIITKPKLMAWLLIPDIKDTIKVKRTFKRGIDDVTKIMDDLVQEIDNESDPEVKLKLRDQYHKMWKTFADRAAPIIQRQEIKQMTIKHDTAKNDDIEDRIRQLEAELGKKGK